MALNCLTSKIGYYNFCGVKPDKLLLNDLPGFTLSDYEWVTDEEKQTGSDVLDAAIRMGAEKVEEDITAYLYPQVTRLDSWANKTVGEIKENLYVKNAQANKKWGVRIKMDSAPYLALYVNSVSYFPVNSGTGNIEIYNTLTGGLIYTESVTFTGGEVNVYPLDQLFRMDGQIVDVVILIESDVPVYTIESFARGNCGSCALKAINQYMYNDMVSISDSAVVIDRNLKSVNHTGGLIINYTLRCDIADYICGLSVGLKRAIFYAAGISLMDEIIFGKRLNSLTTVNKDDAIALKDRYANEYGVLMDRVVNSAKLPKSPCFYCNPTIKSVNRIP